MTTAAQSLEIVDLLALDSELGELVDQLQRASAVDDPREIQALFRGSMRRLAGGAAYISVSRRNLPGGQYKLTKLLFEDRPVGRPIDAWHDWPMLPTHEGGFIGSVIETPVPKIINHLNLSGDPAVPRVFCAMRSALAVPLFDRGEAVNWGIVFRTSPEWEIAEERLRDFIARGNMLGNTINLLVTKGRIAELNQRLADQLEQVAQLQRSLLPPKTPKVPGLAIATSYLTSNEAGGDYFDFFDMGDGCFGSLIADVSGHGAGAATVMAMLRAILHGFQDRERGPAAMLAHANRELCRNELNSNFVTAFMVVFNADRSVATYSNAGHNPPVMRLPDGETLVVDDARSLPLGIVSDAAYEQASHATVPGASVFHYTDGIVEAKPPTAGGEMFGMSRLCASLGESSGEPSEMIEHVHMRLFQHTGLRSREDDQTIVALQHTGV